MSTQRRHDKTPSKQYKAVHAAVGGYGVFPTDQFQTTSRPTLDDKDDQLPQLKDTYSRFEPLAEDTPPVVGHQEIANR